jgi:hypothetical protein
MLLAGAGVLSTGLAASAGQACSLTARLKPVGFSDAACQRSLRALVELINKAPTLPDAEIAARAAELSINFAEDVTGPILNYPNYSPVEDLDLIRGWSSWAGRRDRSPIVIHELNLLKAERGIALYQFTFRRDQYHAEVTDAQAAEDSCGAPSPAYYGAEDASYLGVFLNNKLRDVAAFGVWLRKL